MSMTERSGQLAVLVMTTAVLSYVMLSCPSVSYLLLCGGSSIPIPQIRVSGLRVDGVLGVYVAYSDACNLRTKVWTT